MAQIPPIFILFQTRNVPKNNKYHLKHDLLHLLSYNLFLIVYSYSFLRLLIQITIPVLKSLAEDCYLCEEINMILKKKKRVHQRKTLHFQSRSKECGEIKKKMFC